MLAVYIKLLSSLFFLWHVLGVAISQPTKRSASSTDNTFTGLFDKNAVAVCFLCSGSWQLSQRFEYMHINRFLGWNVCFTNPDLHRWLFDLSDEEN